MIALQRMMSVLLNWTVVGHLYQLETDSELSSASIQTLVVEKANSNSNNVLFETTFVRWILLRYYFVKHSASTLEYIHISTKSKKNVSDEKNKHLSLFSPLEML